VRIKGQRQGAKAGGKGREQRHRAKAGDRDQGQKPRPLSSVFIISSYRLLYPYAELYPIILGLDFLFLLTLYFIL
jgi:hypothetical protein